MKLAIMNDWKKKAVLGFASAATLGAISLATTTGASADTVKTVQSGDTLWGISQTTGQSVDSIKSVNHLTSDALCVGQRLTISDPTTNTSADTVKIVQSGDTLWGISQTTGQSVDSIKSANHLTSDVIYVGQRLTISGSTATTTSNTTQATASQTSASAQNTQTNAQSATTQAAAQPTSASVQTTQSTAPQTSASAQNTPASAQSATTQANAQPTSASVQNTQATTSTQSATTQAATPAAANNSSAKNWIAQHESGGSYTAKNGQYYGKYQLSSSYLNGDYSPANQERVADAYVNSRYGSWDNAKQHWIANGWY